MHHDSNDRDKEAFYEQLQATFENVHCRDLLLVMGDLNAKVGSDNLNFESLSHGKRRMWSAE